MEPADLQAFQAPIVPVLCARPSRPLAPQFSAMVINKLAASVSLFTPAPTESRGVPTCPDTLAASCASFLSVPQAHGGGGRTTAGLQQTPTKLCLGK